MKSAIALSILTIALCLDVEPAGAAYGLGTGSAVTGDGILDLIVDRNTGGLTVDTDNVPANVSGFIIDSAGSRLTGDDYTNMLGIFGDDTDGRIADLFISLPSGTTHDLGEVYAIGLTDEVILNDLNINYTLVGIAGEFDGLVSVVPARSIDGDYNEDGTVNAADYTVWRDTLGQSVSAFSGADGDGDQLIAAGDYDLWKANIGAAATGTVSVPEPGTWQLLIGWSVSYLLVSLAWPGSFMNHDF